MIGSFLTSGLVMVFGYAYPAYECYKIVEQNKPDIEQLRFWCQYWILVAMFTVTERIGDTFISWVPMYMEAKLAFFIYLWYPKTKNRQSYAQLFGNAKAAARVPLTKKQWEVFRLRSTTCLLLTGACLDLVVLGVVSLR